MQKLHFKEGVTLVKARPGGGKTIRTLYTLAHSRKLLPALIVSPLRTLRDWMARQLEEFGVKPQRILVFKSREELCPTIRVLAPQILEQIKQRIRYPLLDHVLPAIYDLICKNCKHKETCPYKQQLKLIPYKKYVLCTYKALPALVWRYFRTVYYDEIETFLDGINFALEETLVKDLKEIGVPVHRFFKKIPNPYYRLVRGLSPNIYVPKIDLAKKRFTIISTATPIRPLLSLLRGEDYREITLKVPKPQDILIGLDCVDAVTRNIILYNLACTLAKWPVKLGINSPRKDLTKKLTDDLNASSDQVDLYPDRSKKVIVVTTRGRWFRGVNVDDRPLVLFGWQYQTSVGYPILNPELDVRLTADEKEELSTLMVWATNIQALFRFVRVPSNKHIIVTVNYTFTVRSLWAFMPSYTREIKKIKVSDVLSLLQKLKEVVADDLDI